MTGRTDQVERTGPIAGFEASTAERSAHAPGRFWLAAEAPRVALGWQLMASSLPLLPTAARGDGHPVLVLPGLGAVTGRHWRCATSCGCAAGARTAGTSVAMSARPPRCVPSCRPAGAARW